MSSISQDPHRGQSQPGSTGYPPPGPGPYQVPGGYPPPVKRRTNTMAILALVCAFLFAPAGIVLGVLARREIRRTGEEGWGLATAGVAISIAYIVIAAVLLVIWIIVAIAFTSTVNTNFQNFQ
jgi:Domain of unknown function (DUF4190)